MRKDQEENKKEENEKVLVVPRAVSVEEMFNILSDKIDGIYALLQPKSK